MRHVDYNIHNINLTREYYRALPRPSILQKKEEKYPSINCMNEHDIPLKNSWASTWCVAFRILDNVLGGHQKIWEDIMYQYPEIWRRTCGQGMSVQYQNYNGVVDFPVLKINEHIHRKDLMNHL